MNKFMVVDDEPLRDLVLDEDLLIFHGEKKLSVAQREWCYGAITGETLRFKRNMNYLRGLSDRDLIQLVRRKKFGYVLNVGDLRRILDRYPDDAILLGTGKEITVVRPSTSERMEQGDYGENLEPILFEEV